MSLERKIRRNKEKEKLKEIQKTYGKKPKEKCPYCHNKSLFYTNEMGQVYCIRCDMLIKIGNK